MGPTWSFSKSRGVPSPFPQRAAQGSIDGAFGSALVEQARSLVDISIHLNRACGSGAGGAKGVYNYKEV